MISSRLVAFQHGGDAVQWNARGLAIRCTPCRHARRHLVASSRHIALARGLHGAPRRPRRLTLRAAAPVDPRWGSSTPPARSQQSLLRGLGLQDLGGRLSYQYYLWRTDTTSDLVLFSSVFAVLVVAGALVKALVEDHGLPAGALDLWRNLYEVIKLSLGQDLPPSVPASFLSQLFSVGVASLGLAAFALVLALVEQVVFEVFEENVRQGSMVYEEGHVLVLSWCSGQRDFEVLTKVLFQLCMAYRADGGTTVVVLSQRPKLEMEASFRRILPEAQRHGSRFVFRTGCPLVADDLRAVSAHTASTALVLADQSRGPDEADAQSVRCAIMLDELEPAAVGASAAASGRGRLLSPLPCASPLRSRSPIVVELLTNNALATLYYACSCRAVAVPTAQLNARRIAKILQHPVVSSLSQQMMSYQNPASCLYVQSFPELTDVPFAEIAFRFEAATVLGVVHRTSRRATLNPDLAHRLAADEDLVLLRPTDVSFPGFRPLPEPIPGTPPPEPGPWSGGAAHTAFALTWAEGLRGPQPAAAGATGHLATATARGAVLAGASERIAAEDAGGGGGGGGGGDAAAAAAWAARGAPALSASSLQLLLATGPEAGPQQGGGNGSGNGTGNGPSVGSPDRHEGASGDAPPDLAASGSGGAATAASASAAAGAGPLADPPQDARPQPPPPPPLASTSSDFEMPPLPPLEPEPGPGEAGALGADGAGGEGLWEAGRARAIAAALRGTAAPASAGGEGGGAGSQATPGSAATAAAAAAAAALGADAGSGPGAAAPGGGAGSGPSPLASMGSGSATSSSDTAYSSTRTLQYLVPMEYFISDERAECVLLCGWGEHRFMSTLLRELDHGNAALAPGSEVLLMNDHDPATSLTPVLNSIRLSNIRVRHLAGDPLQRAEMAARVDVTQLKAALVLCDERWVDPDLDASNGVDRLCGADMMRLDALAMMVQLNIRKLLEDASRPTINIVCQKVASIGVTRFEDRERLPLGLPVNFASYSAKLLTMCAVNPTALAAYANFGSLTDLVVQDASLLAAPGERLSFLQLIRRAQSLQQCLVGFYQLPASVDEPLTTVVNPRGHRARCTPRVWNRGNCLTKFVLLRNKAPAAAEAQAAAEAEEAGASGAAAANGAAWAGRGGSSAPQPRTQVVAAAASAGGAEPPSSGGAEAARGWASSVEQDPPAIYDAGPHHAAMWVAARDAAVPPACPLGSLEFDAYDSAGSLVDD